jgi:multisubunit Na+/H+ antiporter MnhB subunit
MIAWLESLPTATAGVVVVGSIVLLALAIGYVVGKFTSREVRNAHNDRAGFILAVIGVIYAVLLAFVAIGVWERFQGAETRSYDEAGALANVYRDAGSFPGKVRLRATIRAYVRSVIGLEWPRMRRGERSDLSNELLETVGRDVRELPVSSGRQANIQGQMLSAMDTAFVDRQARLTVDSSGISAIMWVVLVVGAIVTIAFTYLFGFDQTIMQELMIGGLSFLIGLVMFLILALDFPFRGSIAVTPEAFRALLESFNAIGG